MLDKFIHYYEVARKMQSMKFEGNPNGYTEEDIADDLAFHVPIYDVVNRRYAAFSSFPEAVFYKSKDPKGNGKQFEANTVPKEDFLFMCYLFRLCGSGINYKSDHGFGNFWIVDQIRRGYYRRDSWIDSLPKSGFCDVKGYMLPQISKELHGGLYGFIKRGIAYQLFLVIMDFLHTKREIYQVVDWGNNWLVNSGLKRQNFVLCAFAMDVAEYAPELVDRDSRVLLGSNAIKCYKQIFPGRKNTFDEHNAALQELCDITGNKSKPYSMEDVMCDFIRYVENFQSPDHIEMNNGIRYYNSL